MIPGLPVIRRDRLAKPARRWQGLNQVNPQQVIFAQQNPDVIDQGVFHNDVIAVSNRQVLFCHQQAFASPVTVTGKPACAGQWFYGDRSSGNSGFRV
ncbi:N-succinylarginine dihydrolase [Escherichia coli]|uniref:N-succinylarginine dihydrolase n=1 Tax=Escherichia coli TaxID=562 RepID=A0A376WYX8_ECOLX|nr:N-succinylarginine dihydrolase [Escherichia coli]